MRPMSEMVFPQSPGALDHASIGLANSVYRTGGKEQDELGTPASTSRWLIERGLVAEGSVLQSYCQNRLVGLRGHLQAAFGAFVAGDDVDPGALAAINSALVAAPYSPLLRFSPGSGFSREVEHPTTQLVEHSMSVIAEDAASLLSGDEAQLLARCEAESCTRFLLRTHGRRLWCSTRCGDRVRAARAYARKRALLNA